MYLYIHTYIATREAFGLSPLQPTEPIHVRLIFSPCEITKEDYLQYLEWIDSKNQCSEFHTMGAVAATLTKASLLPPAVNPTQVGAVQYDFMLEALEDYHAYLEFVRQTLLVEVHRPIFRPQTKTNTESEIDLGSDPSLPYNVTIGSTLVQTFEDAVQSELPTFLLVHPPKPKRSHATYALWFDTTITYKHRAKFYRLEDATKQEPKLLAAKTAYWLHCTSEKDIQSHMYAATHMLYQLSNGIILQEKNKELMWETLLGKEPMPAIQIRATLSLQSCFLTKKQGEEVLETRLTEAQLAVIRPFFTESNLQPFSLSALYDLFAAPKISQDLPKRTIRTDQLIGVNTVGAKSLPKESDVDPVGEMIRAANATVRKATEKAQAEGPEGKDTYACAWEPVNAAPVNGTAAAFLHAQVKKLLHEFKESQPPLQNADADATDNAFTPALVRYGFLLYLLHKQQTTRFTTTVDYDAILDYYTKSNMDVSGVQFAPQHRSILYPLLAANTAFLDHATLEEFTPLKARILLSLYQYPTGYRNPTQQIKLFQMMVKEFAKGLKKGDDRVGAKALWDAFVGYLRKLKLDYVGFFGTQQEFNEVLRELGWEQKRIAAGKVWMNMELPDLKQ